MRFLPTQQKIVNVLADGEGHPATELVVLLPSYDPKEFKAAMNALGQQIHHLNKVLATIGHKVVCEYRGKHAAPHYRRVRLLGKDNE